MLKYSHVWLLNSRRTRESSLALADRIRVLSLVSAVSVSLPLSVKPAIQSVTCHRASPVMAVPINVFLCHTAHYRHRYYTALLMALSDGLFTEPVTKTGGSAISLCAHVCTCVFSQSEASRVHSGNKRPHK